MKLLKSLSIYTFSSFFSAGLSFLLLPVFTHYLSKEDYGIIGLITTSVALLVPFIGLSSHGTIQAEYYRLSRDKLANYISTTLWNSFIVFALFLLIAFLVSNLISATIGLPQDWIWLIPFMALFSIPIAILLVLLQSENKPILYGIFSITQAIVGIGIGLFFVIVLDYHWKGRMLGIVLTGLLFFIISIIILYRKKLFNFSYNLSYSKSAILFGLPLIPHAVGGFIIESSDRYFIASMLDLSELGIYNLGYQIGGLIGMLDAAFVQAFIPFFYENVEKNTKESNIKVVRISYLYLIGLLASVIGLYIFAPFLFTIFIDKKFLAGERFVFMIALGYFFVGVYKMFAGYIFYFKKTKYLAYLALINVVLNLILNYFLIKHYGAMGAAYATTISYFVVAVLIIIVSNRVHRMPWLNFSQLIKL